MPEEHAPIENQAATEPEAPGMEPATRSVPTPIIALTFVIIALLGVLIVIGLRTRMAGGDGVSSEVLELQAEANALRDQLNRERMAAGLRPLEGRIESVDEVAARLKKDADVMVALANSFQSMIAKKDDDLTEKNADLIRSKQLANNLAAEVTRLQDELRRASANGSDPSSLRRELEELRAERDALRVELADKSGGISHADFADLQRRLDETLRAKEFFEARAKELEADTPQH